MTTLRWLHFTDLHIGQKDEGLWSSAKQALLDDLRRTTAELGPWDVVLFTGDLVYSGKKKEFERLDRELAEVWAIFAAEHPGAPPPFLLAVPGNHDLARPGKADAVAKQLVADDDDVRNALWTGERDPLATVKKWFREYAAWWDRCRPKTDLAPGLLPGEFVWTLTKDGVRFGFVGMSTAFAHAGDVREGQLWLDARQVAGACGGNLLAWARAQHFAFLLTHHPPSWLTRDAKRSYEAEIAPPGTFTAHLCGHLHESLATQTRAGRGGTREIWQGASLFGLEKAQGVDVDHKIDRKHGYTAGELKIEDGVATTRLWPRLGVKRQDGSWAITADVTYQLRGDLLATAAEPVAVSGSLPVAPTSVVSTSAGPAPAPAPATWREAVEAWPHWPTGGDEDALRRSRELAAEIAALCWEQWESALRDLPGDPWRDQDLPLRQLDRLAALVKPGALNAQETALLLAAPFLREGLFSAGACWMAGAHPLIVPAPDPEHRARKVLENVHDARPALVRRMEKEAADSPVRSAVGFWLMTQALRQCPHLWEAETEIPHARLLEQKVEAALGRAGAGFPPLWRLIQLVRHLGFGAEVFQTEGRIDRDGVAESDGVRVDLRVLARALCAAGAWSLDLRLAADLVADHAGREGFTPALALETLRAARWTSGADGDRLLVNGCSDPVVDFLLRDDLVPRAEQVIERLRQDRAANPHLWPGGLPAHLRHEITILPGPDDRPRYRVPHVRFQLDHDQVRELLMGVQLYGDPSLAIRELYQNALDACRYRRARAEYRPPVSPYEGRIEIQQGHDADGRAYIECTDNGVGMDAAIVEQVFAVAGRRFQDTPEFVEEAARWKTSGHHVELSPNSRFGIGVLSYFMLADEVEIHTRRYLSGGGFGKALEVRISSAGGLFRMQEGGDEVMRDGGTRVRLYLSRTTYEIKDDEDGALAVLDVSCHRTLGELLWVAEFATSVAESGKETLRWQPGIPSPGGKAASPAEFLATGSPNVWWAAWTLPVRDLRQVQAYPLLVDGIATRTQTHSMLVSLPRARCSQLSVDRQHVLVWDEAWAESDLHASIPRLLGWEGLTMTFLWGLVESHPALAERVVAALCEKGLRLPVALIDSGRGGIGREHTADVRALGCVPTDAAFFGDVATLNLLSAWRASNWITTGGMPPQRRWPTRDHISALPPLPMRPGDLEILRVNALDRDRPIGSYFGRHQSHLVIGALDVTRVALLQDRPVAEIHERACAYLFLGFEVDMGGVEVTALESLRSRRDELSDIVAWLSWWVMSQGALDLLNVAAYAVEMNQAVSAILGQLEVLAAAGLPTMVQSGALLSALVEGDLRILSQDLYARPPWISGPISPLHVRAAAKKLGVSTGEIVARLRRYEPLGLKVPEYQAERWAALLPEDLAVLDPPVQHEAIIHEYAGTVLHLLDVSRTRRLTLGEARRRLEALTWTGVTLPQLDAAALDRLAAEEPRLRDAARYFGHGPVTAVALTEAADAAGGFATAARIASRLQILPEALQRAVASLSVDVDGDTVTILSAYENAPGADRETRRRRGYATTRFNVWQPSPEKLATKLRALAPLIEYILDQPPPE